MLADMERLRRFTLITDLPPYSFLFMYQNVQSLRKHFHVAKSQPFVDKSDCVFFCETWLDSADMSEDYKIENFTLRRFDNQGMNNRQHAGYVLNSKTNSICVESTIIHGVQFVIVDIQHIHLILVAVHRRPYATNVEQFKEALIHIIEPYACRKMCLFGDFNLESSSASNLAELLSTYHLHRLNDEFTTEGQTNIDLVFL